MIIERTEQEIEELMNWARQGVQKGSHYTGQSYEDGIISAIEWITGDTDDHPSK